MGDIVGYIFGATLIMAMSGLLLLDMLLGFDSIRKWIKEQPAKLKSLGAWIKERWEEYKNADTLKQIYIPIALVVLACLIVLFFNLLDDVLGIPTNKDESAVRNTAIAFIGTVSGIGALFGVYLAILRSEENKRQNDTAVQGLITDRINKAVESLGKINNKDDPLREVRIGALYALERIAQDSLEDHVRIMKIICGYVYVNSQVTDQTDKTQTVGEDIRAALTIIGERGNWTAEKEHLKEEKNRKYRLDLRNCNLHNASLNHANLSNAMIIAASLQQAHLRHADFTNASLTKVNLNYASLHYADFANARTHGALAYKGDFSKCLNLTQARLNRMFLGMDIDMPPERTHPQEGTKYGKIYNNIDDFNKAYKEWLKENHPDLA